MEIRRERPSGPDPSRARSNHPAERAPARPSDERSQLARISEALARTRRVDAARIRELGTESGAERTERRSEPRSGDRIEVSDRARILARAFGSDLEPPDAADRIERIAELKELYQSGRLFSDERIRQAAQRLLGGDEPR